MAFAKTASPVKTAAAAVASRTATRKAKAATDAAPSILDLFVADLKAECAKPDGAFAYGVAYLAHDVAMAWCATNHPPIQGKRETPEATLLSNLGTAREDDKLSEHGIAFVKGETLRQTFPLLPRKAVLIVVDPSDQTAGAGAGVVSNAIAEMEAARIAAEAARAVAE